MRVIRVICFHLFACTYTAILSVVTAQVSDYANVSHATADRPNILFCISDDQSYAHTGANGDPVVQTPAFDRVAREGLRFTHAFCDAPTCGPSRSAILTGQHLAFRRSREYPQHTASKVHNLYGTVGRSRVRSWLHG